MASQHCPPCDGWVLSGGKGSRMGGQDKGLVNYHDHPMAWQVANRLAPQVKQVKINANRNLSIYQTWPWPVHTDDVHLPTMGGPMIGVMTGLMHSHEPWLQIASCDVPSLPHDLTSKLFEAAITENAMVAVPVSRQENGHVLWHHWTNALISSHCSTNLAQAIQAGERRLGRWITQQRWVAVFFDSPSTYGMFNNINS